MCFWKKASARQKVHQTPEKPTKILLTPAESDNVFTTLEEDFNSVRIPTNFAGVIAEKQYKLWWILDVENLNRRWRNELWKTNAKTVVADFDHS